MAYDLTRACEAVETFDADINCQIDNPTGYPAGIMIAPYTFNGVDNEITVVATNKIPTVAEVQTFLTAKKGLFFRITDGVKPETEKIEKDAAATYVGIPEVIRENESIQGNFRKIDNTSLLAFKQNNLNMKYCRVWWVDNYGRWYGENTGFKAPTYIGSFSNAGYGNESIIPVNFVWEVNQKKAYLISDPDLTYLDVSNTVTVGSYSTHNTVGTSGSEISDHENILGWNKVTYPTVYVKVLTGSIITFYPTSADRTAATNALAKVDAATDNIVDVLNTSGWSGTITFDSISIVDNDTFEITYSEI